MLISVVSQHLLHSKHLLPGFLEQDTQGTLSLTSLRSGQGNRGPCQCMPKHMAEETPD